MVSKTKSKTKSKSFSQRKKEQIQRFKKLLSDKNKKSAAIKKIAVGAVASGVGVGLGLAFGEPVKKYIKHLHAKYNIPPQMKIKQKIFDLNFEIEQLKKRNKELEENLLSLKNRIGGKLEQRSNSTLDHLTSVNESLMKRNKECEDYLKSNEGVTISDLSKKLERAEDLAARFKRLYLQCKE